MHTIRQSHPRQRTGHGQPVPGQQEELPGIVLDGLSAAVPDGGSRRVLFDRLDLQVAPAEVVAITGGSGSGKSTLLALAGLLRRPEHGEVVIGGVATSGLSERQRTELRRTHVGIVYQSANLLPALTASEQLELVAHLDGERGTGPRERARSLLGDVGLARHADHLPAQLSGGERQRVSIARALMSQPTVLLADEPTASLDPDLADEVATLLATEARHRGLATIIVTHDSAPLAHADRHLQLANGALVPVSPAGAVQHQHQHGLDAGVVTTAAPQR